MQKEITSWTYTKGELAKDRLENFSLAIAAIIGLIIALIISFSFTKHTTDFASSTITRKFDSWLFLVFYSELAL